MYMWHKLLATSLAGVMILFTLLDVVAVKCSADNRQSPVIEAFGHQHQVTCCDKQACTADHDHEYDHPAECTDEPILSDVVFTRSGVDMESPLMTVAFIAQPFDVMVLQTIDPAIEPQLCPRPPPDNLRSSVDDFVTLRLLV